MSGRICDELWVEPVVAWSLEFAVTYNGRDSGVVVALTVRRMQRASNDLKRNWTWHQLAATMPLFAFDPPLTLKGNIVVRNLDDASRFLGTRRRVALLYRGASSSASKGLSAKQKRGTPVVHFAVGRGGAANHQI